MHPFKQRNSPYQIEWNCKGIMGIPLNSIQDHFRRPSPSNGDTTPVTAENVDSTPEPTGVPASIAVINASC
jgi:hypothetical protein